MILTSVCPRVWLSYRMTQKSVRTRCLVTTLLRTPSLDVTSACVLLWIRLKERQIVIQREMDWDLTFSGVGKVAIKVNNSFCCPWLTSSSGIPQSDMSVGAPRNEKSWERRERDVAKYFGAALNKKKNEIVVILIYNGCFFLHESM